MHVLAPSRYIPAEKDKLNVSFGMAGPSLQFQQILSSPLQIIIYNSKLMQVYNTSTQLRSWEE